MKNNKKGFTLIEIMVVLTILGVLLLLAQPNYVDYTNRVNKYKVENEIVVIEAQIARSMIKDKCYLSRLKDLNVDVADEISLSDDQGFSAKMDYSLSHKLLPKSTIETELNGQFYVDNNGRVYYDENNISLDYELKFDPETIPCDKPIEEEAEDEIIEEEVVYDGIYTEKEIDQFVDSGKIPIANGEEFFNIIGGDINNFALGTKWEGEYKSGLDKEYMLVEDIDMSKVKNFKPIGGSKAFTGSLDGGGFTIDGLEIKSSEYTGLFSKTNGAKISNITIENISVMSNKYVGSLIGYAINTDIRNVSAIGSLKAEEYVGGLVGKGTSLTMEKVNVNIDIKAEEYVGGLIGISESSNINKSSSRSIIKGGEEYVGGLIGYGTSTNISNSYMIGNIRGEKYVGGIIGYGANINMSNSYSIGETRGEEYIGGLIGRLSSSVVSNTYSSSSVRGEEKVGGLIGYQSGSIIATSYYNKDLYSKSSGGLGLTESELKDKRKFIGWDFYSVWDMIDGETPSLR